jgi:hypothetical protein
MSASNEMENVKRRIAELEKYTKKLDNSKDGLFILMLFFFAMTFYFLQWVTAAIIFLFFIIVVGISRER